jgi:ATP-dependent helicase/nuclease subunit A
MKNLNSEQLRAVQQIGQASLRAGAGSGKTTVLVAHIIYLIEKKIAELNFNDKQFFEIEIRKFLKSKVLMTFTRKASGEMKIRLHQEVSKKIDDPKWLVIHKNLDFLLITTIDGFCSKLIKKGFIPGINPDFNIANAIEIKNKFYQILDLWYLQKNAAQTQDEIIKNLFYNKESVLNSIVSIFNDPSKRKEWSKFNIHNFDLKQSYSMLENWVELLGYSELKKCAPNIDQELKDKKWALVIKFFADSKFSDFKSFIKFADDLKNISYRVTQPKENEELALYYKKIIIIRDEIKEVIEHIKFYEENFQDHVYLYMKSLIDLIQFIELQYSKIPVFSYADLEFYTYLGLLNKQTQEEVYENYDYLIVDEFQDTSEIQFEILKLILKENYDRLYVVGDVKQAIYGFRGGEVSVFKNVQQLVQNDMSLNLNYRSTPSIIKYNNELYFDLFKVTEDFISPDYLSPNYDPQDIPAVNQEKAGQVTSLLLKCPENITTYDIDYLEANVIFEKISQIKNNLNQDEDIAILYRKLKASIYLRNLFIQNKIGFTSQVKIQIKQDPIIGLFNLSVLFLINKDLEINQKSFNELINYYLKHLEQEYEHDHLNNLFNFCHNYKYFGLYESYILLLKQMNISTSRYSENLFIIKSIIELYGQNIDLVYEQLNLNSESSLNLEFYYGDNPHLIKIMTAHASKGLQFSHVFVASLYSSDTKGGGKNSSNLGNNPGSFRFKKSWDDKENFLTPYFIFEKKINALKEFSEMKRLLYVATTRAISSLYWVDIVAESKNEYGGIWYKMFKKFGAHVNSTETISINFDNIKSQTKGLKFPLPFFHQDTLGTFVSPTREAFFLSDLSVTRLSQILKCPRKFYFKNILKLDEPPKEIEFQIIDERSEKSSLNRGSEIHKFLEYLSYHNWVVPLKHNLNDKDIAKINWVVDLLKMRAKWQSVKAEEEVKFQVGQFMINGVIDLSFLGPNGIEIWDYKTGKISEENLESYWFQLKTYAYSFYQLNKVDKISPIRIVLCFLDEMKLIENTVTMDEVSQLINKTWEKIKKPDEINLSHCEKCEFKLICH